MTPPSLLIVGGTHGIGLEIARRYTGEGWTVVVAGRDGAHAKSMAAELGGETRGIALDLSEPEQIADALADIDDVDHIVLSAIIRDTNMINDYDIAAARYLAIMKIVGYTGVVSALRERLEDDGSVVLFGGRAKDRPYQGSTTVTAVNGAISAMVRTLALQLAPRRVNAIHPGIVGDSPYWSDKPAATAKARDETPTGRSVTMADIVDGVDFLMRNRSVNGIDLYVDGGWLLT
jgi:NAD(P)-dependent dehydrogenase (short-subunit alcohol dehydrogenase family)